MATGLRSVQQRWRGGRQPWVKRLGRGAAVIRGHSAAYAFALFERLGHMELVSDEVERERPVDADDGVEPVASAAYMVYISRGGWWKGLNACGEVVPEGNRPIEGKLVIAAIEAGCKNWVFDADGIELERV